MKSLSLLVLLLSFAFNTYAADPLPSWNDGELKKSIINFVNEVTKTGSPKYVRPQDRIATFDNDGTLWSEVPTVEVEFTKRR